jgi:dihydroflavonol-4-reductase
LENKNKYQHLLDMRENMYTNTKLNLFEADLSDMGSFDKVIGGCDYVLHIASPVAVPSTKITDAQKEYIDPAVNGTRNVLEASKKSNTVKRFVFTSSGGAIYNPFNIKYDHIYSEKDWNTDASLDYFSYHHSKVLAEKSVFSFIEREKPLFDAVALNPTYIFGEPLNYYKTKQEINGSNRTYLDHLSDLIYNKKLSTRPTPGLIDVRDAAKAHILAMKTPQASMKRIFVTHSGKIWCDLVKEVVDSISKSNDPSLDHLKQKLSYADTTLDGDYEVSNYLKCDTRVLFETLPAMRELIPVVQTFIDITKWFDRKGFI